MGTSPESEMVTFLEGVPEEELPRDVTEDRLSGIAAFACEDGYSDDPSQKRIEGVDVASAAEVAVEVRSE